MTQLNHCTPLTPEEIPIMPLHPSEERLIRHIRELGHGSIEIKVADGYPVLIEKEVKRIKLV